MNIKETPFFFVWQGASSFLKRRLDYSVLPLFKKGEQRSPNEKKRCFQDSFNPCFLKWILVKGAKHHAATLYAVLLASLLLAAPALAMELRDQAGRLVTLPDKAQRIVTLAPNITEMVFALGAGGSVVGCCQHSDFPPEIINLPRVGSYYRPNLERIVALRPDLCLAVRDGTPRIVLDRLEQLNIPVLTLDPQSLEGLRETTMLLGVALNRREKAEKLIADMDARLAWVDAVVAGYIHARGTRPTVLVRVQAKPFMAAARGTFPAELVERAGGLIPLRGGSLYPCLSPEDLLALRPDAIIATRGGQMHADGPHSAINDAPVRSVDEDLLFRPSLRSLEALDSIIALLWPQVASAKFPGREVD